MLPRPAAPAAAPGNLLKMRILSLYLTLTELEALGVGPNHLSFNKPPRQFQRLRNATLSYHLD